MVPAIIALTFTPSRQPQFLLPLVPALSLLMTYLLLDEKGPDHSKCFLMSAQVGKTRFPPAWGRSKKQAEQFAAKNALDEIET